MRALVLLTILGTAPVLAQPQSAADPAAGNCRVVSRPLDVNQNGEIYQPPPSPEDCATVDALVEKFRSTDPRAFGQNVAVEGIPGPVHIYIGPMRPYGPWPFGEPASRPVQRHISTWRSDKLVVVVYETSDFAGPTTTVVISDLETLTVCTYPNWPDNEDPVTLRIPEIQEIFDATRIDRQEPPPCRLGSLAVEDALE